MAVGGFGDCFAPIDCERFWADGRVASSQVFWYAIGIPVLALAALLWRRLFVLLIVAAAAELVTSQINQATGHPFNDVVLALLAPGAMALLVGGIAGLLGLRWDLRLDTQVGDTPVSSPGPWD
jgi:hypothetical protein